LSPVEQQLELVRAAAFIDNPPTIIGAPWSMIGSNSSFPSNQCESRPG